MLAPKIVPVVGYEGYYEVSSEGVIYSVDKWIKRKGRNKVEHTIYRTRKELTPKKRGAYFGVQLYKDGVKKYASIHRVVAEAFLENPNGYKQVNHKDENKYNNKVENLEWCTASYNQSYSKSKPCWVISPIGENVLIENQKKFCRDNNLHESGILRMKQGRQYQHKGWRLKF